MMAPFGVWDWSVRLFLAVEEIVTCSVYVPLQTWI
jgi:hypothetical protein